MAKEIRIVRKDKLLAGYNGNLESVIILKDGATDLGNYDATTMEYENGVEVSNGVFVKLGKLMKGANQREVFYAYLADEGDKEEDVLLIHNAEVMYDERLYKLEDFRIANGKVARAYRLFDGDIITLTEDLFDGEVEEGDVLTVKANGLLGVPTDADGAKVVFEVIEDCGNELHHTAKAFAVKVKRN